MSDRIVAQRVTWPAPPGNARSAALRDASWIFAGPGSPTYVLRQWRDTPIPSLIAERADADEGAVIFASAAALTLGSHTIPVYEIYKAGVDPAWVPGLDLVRARHRAARGRSSRTTTTPRAATTTPASATSARTGCR